MLKIEAQGARDTDMHPSADVINTYLAGVSVEAEQEEDSGSGAAAKKRENNKLAHLRKTIAALQDAVLRANPASRGVVARRLSVMKASCTSSLRPRTLRPHALVAEGFRPQTLEA